MVFNEYTKRRILFYHAKDYRPRRIAELLLQEGITASSRGIALFIARCEKTGTSDRRPGSSRPTKITNEMKAMVEKQMARDDETTVKELHIVLAAEDIFVSHGTVLRCRKKLGWTFRGIAYCQMIRAVNKTKRLEWARTYASEADTGFQDVIFTDETSVQLESHRPFCCRKTGQPPKPKPRYG